MSYLAEADHIWFQIHCTTTALDGLHTAMVEGSSTAESYTDGLFGLICYLRELEEQLYECIETGLHERKEVTSYK